MTKTIPCLLGVILAAAAGAAEAPLYRDPGQPVAARVEDLLARSVGQLPVFYNYKPSSRTRGYVLDDDRPLYPFGFGLSYTTLAFSHARVRPLGDTPGALAEVSVDVANTGARAAKETVQLYVHQVISSVTRPVMELRDFAKVELMPSETRTVSFVVTPEKLAYHDEAMRRVVQPGEFEFMVGPSAAETQTVTFTVAHEIELPQG